MSEAVSRRGVLAGGLALGAGVALAASLKPTTAEAQPMVDLPQLNALLRAEYDAVLTYAALIGYCAAPDMSDAGRSVAPWVAAVTTRFRDHHDAHAAALSTLIMSMGGTPVSRSSVSSPMIPSGFTLSVSNALKLASNKEKAASIAYAGALTTLTSRAAAEVLASIGAVQTQHFIVLYLAAKGIVRPAAASTASFVAPRPFASGHGSDGLQDVADFVYGP